MQGRTGLLAIVLITLVPNHRHHTTTKSPREREVPPGDFEKIYSTSTIHQFRIALPASVVATAVAKTFQKIFQILIVINLLLSHGRMSG